jgi:formate-dependent nitrite reductase cytochrome c552 subunit
MLEHILSSVKLMTGGRLIALCCVLGMVGLFLATPASAQSPEPTVEPCESCHSPEAEAWMVSPHANVPEGSDVPGATCEACHGPYVKGHPDNDVMELRVDSAMCQDCHASTFDQWQGTVHADANVQCISCHVSHSQDLRLTDEKLCRACHQESLTDPFHSAHWYVEASCTDCHMAGEAIPGAMVMIGNDGVIAGGGHDFTTVSSEKCLDCHRGDVASVGNARTAQQLALADLRTQTLRVAELDAQLEVAKQTTYQLQVMTPMTLGFGIGIGGMIGIIFMLVMSRLGRKDKES